jgi:hypothetical protein
MAISLAEGSEGGDPWQMALGRTAIDQARSVVSLAEAVAPNLFRPTLAQSGTACRHGR